MMDKIVISAIDCLASIGVTPEERAKRQRLSVDLEFFTDARRAAASDSIDDTIDYAKVAKLVSEVCRGRDFRLVETLADTVADRVLSEFRMMPQVRVLIRKISPIEEPRVNHVAIEVVRSR